MHTNRSNCVRDWIPRGESDASVTTGQLETTIINFMIEKNSNDLVKLFKGLEASSNWNSSPSTCIRAIANLDPFYTDMVRLCPNGMFPRKRLRDALVNVNNYRLTNDNRPHLWNFAARATTDAAHQLGTTMRRGASKLRDLKANASTYIAATRGLSADSRLVVDRLMDGLAPTTAAQSVARQYSAVDSDGCHMEIFDTILRDGLVRYLRESSSCESYVAQPSECTPPPLRSSKSSEDTQSVRSCSQRREQLPPRSSANSAHDHGSFSTPVKTERPPFGSPPPVSAKQLVPRGRTHVKAEHSQPNAKPRVKPAIAGGPVRAPRAAASRVQSCQLKTPDRLRAAKRRSVAGCAYKKAFKEAGEMGMVEPRARAKAQAAYAAAGIEYDKKR